MVDQILLDNLQKVCSALEEAKGTVYLFAVLKMDDITDKWTIVISAAWVEDTSFEEAFGLVRKLLLEELKDDISSIARIGIFRNDEHLPQLMIDKYKSGDSIKEDQQINGNLVHEGYFLKVQPVA